MKLSLTDLFHHIEYFHIVLAQFLVPNHHEPVLQQYSDLLFFQNRPLQYIFQLSHFQYQDQFLPHKYVSLLEKKNLVDRKKQILLNLVHHLQELEISSHLFGLERNKQTLFHLLFFSC